MKILKCKICGSVNLVTFHITEINDDQIGTYDLCQKCGETLLRKREKPVELDLTHIQTPEDLLNFIIGKEKPPEEPPCPRCGLTEGDFEKFGRFGCPACYEHFQSHIEKYVYPYHRSKQHVGKYPKRQFKEDCENIPEEKLKVLKLKFAKAVEIERYEEAALLKKEIDALQSKPT